MGPGGEGGRGRGKWGREAEKGRRREERRGDDGENEWMSGRNVGQLESTRSSMRSSGDACGYQEPSVPA